MKRRTLLPRARRDASPRERSWAGADPRSSFPFLHNQGDPSFHDVSFVGCRCAARQASHQPHGCRFRGADNRARGTARRGAARQRPARHRSSAASARRPNDAKPRVWWHWMNGNVTREGITADLEWMERVGIGGMQMFDGSLGTPQFVENRLVWMTPAWKAAFRHAAAEASRLGLEMSMAASGGWSVTGGPWVKPAQAMKKVVWSDTTLEGPRRFTGALPKPPSSNGPFQGMRSAPSFGFPSRHDAARRASRWRWRPPPRPTRRTTPTRACSRSASREGDVRMARRQPAHHHRARARSTPRCSPTATSARPRDARHSRRARTRRGCSSSSRSRSARYAFTFAGAPTTQFIGTPPIPAGRLEWSDDGQDWVTLATLPGPGHPIHQFAARTYTFEPPTARYYRLVLQRPAANPLAASLGMPPSRGIAIAELELSAIAARQPMAGEGAVRDHHRLRVGDRHAVHRRRDRAERRRRPHGAHCARTARSTGRCRPADGRCCAWATR